MEGADRLTPRLVVVVEGEAEVVVVLGAGLGSGLAFGGLARDNRGEREYGVVFALSLNDLPRVRLPLSIDPNPSAR